MRIKAWQCAGACLLLAGWLGTATAAEEEGLVNANFTQVQDQMGFRWDINHQGAISDGTNDCFDNGLQLLVQGSQFSGSKRMQTADRSEYVISQTIAGLEVTRRIRLDPERGVVRYLEIFENKGKAAVSVTAMVQTTVGSNAQAAYSSSGKMLAGELGRRDVGIAISSRPNRPDVLLLLGQAGAKASPTLRVQQNNRVFQVEYPIAVAPGGRAVVLHMVAQRAAGTAQPTALRRAFQELYRGRPLRPDLPPGMEADIVNFRRGEDEAEGGNPLAAVEAMTEALGVSRGAAAVLCIDAENHVSGQVSGGPLRIVTAYGETTVALLEVAMIAGSAGGTRPAWIALRSGEVLVGEAAGRLTLTNDQGVALELSPSDIHVLVLPKSKGDGKMGAAVTGLLATRRGDRLALTGEQDAALEAATAWGPVRLALGEIERLQAIREPAPGFVLVLGDASILAAMPYGSSLAVQTQRFGPQSIEPADLSGYHAVREGWIPADVPAEALADVMLAQAHFAMEDQKVEPVPAFCVLKGGNRLSAELAAQPLAVVTPGGRIMVDPAEVRLIERQEDDEEGPAAVRWPRFTLTLAGGGKMTGRLADRMLHFVQGERQWQVPAADLLAVWRPGDAGDEEVDAAEAEPAEAGKPEATSAPEPGATQGAAAPMHSTGAIKITGGATRGAISPFMLGPTPSSMRFVLIGGPGGVVTCHTIISPVPPPTNPRIARMSSTP